VSPKKPTVLKKALEVLGDQAMPVQTLAHKVGCTRGTLTKLVAKGQLVKVGETEVRTWDGRKNPAGQWIVCAPEHAAKHGGAK